MRGVGWSLWRRHYTPLEARVTVLEDVYVRACWFEEISSGTSGALTLPTGGAIVLNQWSAGVDGLASVVSSSWPTFESPVEAGGAVVTTTLDGDGNYTLSGTPSAYPIAVVYVYRVKVEDFDDTYSMFETELEPAHSALSGIGTNTHAQIDTHLSATGNQHGHDSHDHSSALASCIAADLSDITSAGADIEDAVTKKHASAHSIVSHSDIVDATGANIEELTGGGDTTLHDHDGIAENTAARHTQGTDTALGTMAQDIDMDNSYQVVNLQAPAAAGEAIRQTAKITESKMEAADDHVAATGNQHGHDTHDHSTALGTGIASDLSDITSSGANIEDAVTKKHAEAHTIASHSDTTATGAELETLTDGSETTLHSHAGGGNGGETLTDRGDPASNDFDKTDFTCDATWNEFDMSSVVPENATWAVFRVSLLDGAAGSIFMCREKGNSNAININICRTQVANVGLDGIFTVKMDANRKCEYYASNLVFDAINITVIGWFI